MNLFHHTHNAWKRLTPTAIVCHELKLLYFSIPKAASSTIKRYLREHGYDRENPSTSELTMADIHGYSYPRIGKNEVRKLRSQGYTSFAITRDPYKRLWSCYVDKILKKREMGHGTFLGFRRYNQILRRNIFDVSMSFEAFVEAVSKIPDWMSDGHFRSQHRFLMLDRNALMLDRIIDIDQLDSQMLDFTKDLGLPKWDPPNLNPSKSRSIQPETTDHIRNLVNNRYKIDYELLHYTKS